MENALFINSRSADRFMGLVPDDRIKSIAMYPVWKRSALTGFKVVLNGVTITEAEVEYYDA